MLNIADIPFKKLYVVLFFMNLLSGCVEDRPRQYQEIASNVQNGPRALSTFQTMYTDSDEKECKSVDGKFQLEKEITFSCLNKEVEKLTEKNSVTNEIITASYYVCSTEITSMAKATHDATRCSMARETGKSLMYFDNMSSYDEAKSISSLKNALYPKMVSDILKRKKQLH